MTRWLKMPTDSYRWAFLALFKSVNTKIMLDFAFCAQRHPLLNKSINKALANVSQFEKNVAGRLLFPGELTKSAFPWGARHNEINLVTEMKL
ncbi:hypothetical protein OKN36_09050 [Furfurilactobacillus sp. OKN36]